MKKSVFNYRLIFLALFTLILFFFGMFSITEDKKDYFQLVGFTVIALFPIFALFISPISFLFENDKLTIVYFFGFYEIIEWKNVKYIEKVFMTKRAEIMHIYCYHIVTRGETKGKKAFFTNTEINATHTTKKLIREFWKSDFKPR